METSELIWEEEKGKVYTNKFVVVRDPVKSFMAMGSSPIRTLLTQKSEPLKED
ncbi:MAG: hypothetical protein R2769_06800 [Saprospiraceae bacterium]